MAEQPQAEREQCSADGVRGDRKRALQPRPTSAERNTPAISKSWPMTHPSPRLPSAGSRGAPGRCAGYAHSYGSSIIGGAGCGLRTVETPEQKSGGKRMPAGPCE